MPPRRVVYDKQTQMKLRKRRNRRRFTFRLALFVFLLVAIGTAVSLMVFFKVDRIEVEGKTNYSNEQIISISNIKKGQNLLGINKKSVSLALCSSLPYIESVEIELKPLSTVIIHAAQNEPFGIVAYNKQYILFDKDMKVLEIKQGNSKNNITEFIGLNIKSAETGKKLQIDNSRIKLMNDFYNAIVSNNFDKSEINSLDITDDYQLNIRYDHRIDILLGTETNMDFKLKTAKYLLTENISKTDRGKLDVSNADPNSNGAKEYFDPYQ